MEQIICNVNGVENVDLSAIKCPICGDTMRLCQFTDKGGECKASLTREPLWLGSDGKAPVYREHSSTSHDIGLKCPYCKSVLNVTQTVVKYVKQVMS